MGKRSPSRAVYGSGSKSFANPVSEDSGTDAGFFETEQDSAADAKILAVATFDDEDRPETPKRATGRRPSITMDSFESAAAEAAAKASTFEEEEEEEEENDDNADTGYQASFGERLFAFFEVPGSSVGASVFSFVILLMIVASCACFVLETHEYFQARPDLMRKMALCEVVCIVTFTVEYIVRLCCCNYRPSPNAVGAMGVLRYVFKPMNLIDLLAIAPFWMEQLLHTHAKTEVVRMARMTRIFR